MTIVTTPAETLDVRIETVGPQRSAVVRVEVPMADLPRTIGESLGLAGNAIEGCGATYAGPPFARYLAFDPARIVADIGFPIAGLFVATDRVVEQELPGGRVARVMHIGPYETLAETYGRLETWLGEHGLTAGAPMWESYLSDPDIERDPTTWRTEIVQPLG